MLLPYTTTIYFTKVLGTDDGSTNHGTIVFMYLWTIGLLLILGVVGVGHIRRGHYKKLRRLLYTFLHYLFVVMVMTVGFGMIETQDGRTIQRTGWYGQTSVLLYLTCIFGVCHVMIFLLWLYRKDTTTTTPITPNEQGEENVHYDNNNDYDYHRDDHHANNERTSGMDFELMDSQQQQHRQEYDNYPRANSMA